MIEMETIRVLLIEDDEDDYLLTKELLGEIKTRRFEVEWIKTPAAAVPAMVRNQHDVCLLDYRLGAQNGVELLSDAVVSGCQIPVILLTGMGEHDVDLAAMKAGAADYLVKSKLQPDRIERAIRYAIERKRAAARAAFEQARLSAFGADVGLALAKNAPLSVILGNCCDAMVHYLNAAIAQIWVFRSQSGAMELQAVAGPVVEGDGGKTSWTVCPANPQELIGTPGLFVPSVVEEPRGLAPEFIKEHQLVSFVARPLQLEDRLIGMMSIYSQLPLTAAILQEMGSVANGIALCVERKLTEEALDASENRYRGVVESIKEVIFQVDQFGNWIFLNPAWKATTGFEVKDVLGTFFLDYIHHDERERTRHVFLQLLNRTIDYCRYETRLLTKDGKMRWVELYMQLNEDSTASGSIYDITERRQAEAQAQRLAAFPRVNPNPVLEFTPDGELGYANDAAVELANSLKKDQLLEILPPNVDSIVRRCLAEGTNHLREEVRIGGRTLTWSFFPVESSQVVHCYGADITEVLSLEAQFRHAQKLESVGQLAAGVAHDFNNILTVIQGYSEVLLARMNGDEALTKPIKTIADAARRAAALTRQLLAFSRKQVIQLRVLNLNSVLQNFANMLPRLLGEDIKVESDYADSLPSVEADTGMLEQVVMNLAVNARDAMPNGGTLKITTSAEEITEAYARNHPDASAGTMICLCVSDTGCGMDAETLGRIFEPFFSTKEVGKGTGLGLATVYGIVKQHHGWVEVSSQVGAGTTFKIYLPAVRAGAQTGEDDMNSGQCIRGGNETILLVEDEHPVRELVRDILKQYNYRVIEACSGVEALEVWESENGGVDLLLTDMVMPEGMNGRELARQLRKRKPALKVIYTSGYSPEMVGQNFSRGDTAFLQKPYAPPLLAQRVRETLDRPVKDPRRREELLATN